MKKLFILLIAVVCVTALSAQEFTFGIGNFGMWYVEPFVGLKGISIIPGADSRVLLFPGVGWVGDAYYREIDNTVMFDPTGDYLGSGFDKFIVNGKLGLDLGIAYDETLEKNWLYSYVFIKTTYQTNYAREDILPNLSYTLYPDKNGLWQNSMFLGVYLDKVRYDNNRQTASGIYAEISGEYAPSFFMNNMYGDSDFIRGNVTVKGFLPIVEGDSFSLYLGDRLVADILGGAKIPSIAARQVGGFTAYSGAGGAVRGIESGRYDSFVKIINNFDVRAPFLPLFNNLLVPEFFAFFDAALVDNLDYNLGAANQTLLTTGAGLALNLNLGGFHFDVGVYLSYSILENQFKAFNLMLGAHQF
mgnify:CR=1 FL=1